VEELGSVKTTIMTHDHTHDDHDDFGGLHRDLHATGAAMDRRGLLRLAARFGLGAGALQLIACGESSPTAPSTTSSTTSTTTTTTTTSGTGSTGTTGACASRVPEETAGPYPGDGSNGPNVLTQSGVVRSDIRASFAGLSGSAAGVPLTITMTLVSASTCEPLAGRAVYLWHCDREGRYSLYSSGVTNQNYLRGVQEADSSGRVTFTSIFPGCYSGRWPHIHFEVYPSLSAAASVANKSATSQIALPKEACDAVYATTGYSASVTNLSRVSLATDGIFSDGYALELATAVGSASTGYVATLTVAV
jgi:protocatechuate 3,4-dioxygenase beta subunit